MPQFSYPVFEMKLKSSFLLLDSANTISTLLGFLEMFILPLLWDNEEKFTPSLSWVTHNSRSEKISGT